LSVNLLDEGASCTPDEPVADSTQTLGVVIPFWLCEPCLERAIGDPHDGTQAEAGHTFDHAGDLTGPLCAQCAAGFRQRYLEMLKP
jgi:hypothetical protein